MMAGRNVALSNEWLVLSRGSLFAGTLKRWLALRRVTFPHASLSTWTFVSTMSSLHHSHVCLTMI